MIRIVEDKDSFAESCPFEHMNECWREDKDIHKKIRNLYEQNFKRFLKSINKEELFEYYLKHQSLESNSDNIDKVKEVNKLNSKYNKIRPYIYIYKNKYFVLYSQGNPFETATLFQFTDHEIAKILEKKNLSKISKITRKVSEYFFVDPDDCYEVQLDKNLEKSCEDILYEIVMFESVGEKILLSKLNKTDQKFYLDSFLIHFRTLYHFFYSTSIIGDKRHYYPKDNLAEFYLPNYKDFIKQRTALELFKLNDISYINKVNKQLAHLSLERRDDNYQLEISGGWNVDDMKKKLYKTIEVFFNLLPVQKKQWFKQVRLDDLSIPPNIKKLYN